MERDRGFSFKLLVPPRLNKGQVSVTRPQETVDNRVDFMNTVEQGYSKCSDKEQSMCFSSASMVAPTKTTRSDFPKMKAVQPMEKNEVNHSPGQLYSKLFDEVEKIKSWKIKADSDTAQKERRLQENKKTIETQRKAIQELQFGNESLSMKLEEQFSENEELRDKDNATRTLCNILKDTFEHSAEKMLLFQSEREETHHLLMENSGQIQKMVKAFESLQIQVQADQQEMEKVKEGFQQFEVLKEKYNEEYSLKEQEVSALQTKLKEKENELQKILLDFSKTQKHCRQLEETTGEQCELLKISETERGSLLQKLQSVEQCLKDTDKNCEALTAQLVKSKEEYTKMIQIKDQSLQELSGTKNQQAEKLEQIQKTIQELQNSLSFEIHRAKELEAKLSSKEEELERKSKLLGETMKQSVKKDGQIQSLEDELGKRSSSVKVMEVKIRITEDRVNDLEAKLVKKSEEAQLLKKEADVACAENVHLKKTLEAAEKEQEVKVKELEQQLFAEMKKKEEQASEMEQLQKDFTLQEEKYTELLSTFNELQSEKKAIEQQLESGSSNVKAIKVSEEKVMSLIQEIQRLEEENQNLREEVNTIQTKIQEKCQDSETLQQKIEERLSNLRRKFDLKLKANEEFQKENKALKKQIAKEIAKSSELERTINSIHEETQNLKHLNEEDRQKLLNDLESKSTSVAELENEVQKLRLTTAEAIKDKEDAELKCQHKITDMVTLMEKHKSRYDQIVEGKDAELNEKKNREMEAVAQMKSLELDLLKNKAENDQLKQQLKTEVTEKANLQTELTDLKKEVSSMKITQLSEARNEQYSQGKSSDTLKQSSAKRYVFDLSKCRRTPCNSKAIIIDDKKSDFEFMGAPFGTTPKNQKIQNADLKTPQSVRNRAGGSAKIRSYRIKTPPLTEQAACWGKSTVELDPKSDSSDLNDLLTLVSAPRTNFLASPSQLNSFKKIQSPVPHKSPGNSLKLAAMKRMRDAGWTAVTGCDKKKKKSTEKIFA